MKQIRLYDYQLDMKRRIEAAFKSHRSVMVQMPTGTGKTYLLASCVNEWIAHNEGEVWIVAHRRELVEQIKGTIEKNIAQVASGRAEKIKALLRVVSIQWLSRHFKEIDGQPSLIVIDEAHHALAKTYAELLKAFPQAKKLGVTATPCRLTRKGFNDLFEVLLMSKPIAQFIKEGYLADFDYVSLNPNSEDQKKINGLEKRATDGDYNTAEMQEVLDTRPTIERLFLTIGEFAKGKKGIVYAINIAHAEHIAAYYAEHGVNAVAISSKTPDAERRASIEKFKEGGIQVLVNVDLFGEGFDCPDVEFIQLARPTLSLAKYLQMVGRGLRVARNKECCTILDNVGLYRLFGLPNAERDWEAMFLGKQTGMGVADVARDWALKVCNFSKSTHTEKAVACNRDMVVIAQHDVPRIAEQISILLAEFGKAQNFKYEKHGLLGDHTYIRTCDDYAVFHILGEERLGWKIMYNLQTSPRRYYLLNNASGQIKYVGRCNIWSNDEHAALNDAKVIEVAADNIAEVRFKGDDAPTWVNLNTMQEFDVRPMVVHRNNQAFLRVGGELFSYKNRLIAGIPLSEQHARLYALPTENVEQLLQHGFAKFHSRKKIDIERPWADLVNGIRFAKQPRVETHGFLEFSTADGIRLYPRVPTQLMDNDSFVLPEALAHGIDDGLRFRNFYIPPADTPKVYVFKEKMDDWSLFKDEENAYYTRLGLDSTLTLISLDEWRVKKRKWKRLVADFEKRTEIKQKTAVFQYPIKVEINHGYQLENYSEPTDIRISRNGRAYNTSFLDLRFGKWRSTGSYTEFSKQAYGIRVVRNWEGKYLLRTQFFEKFSSDVDPKFDFAELLNDAYLHIKDSGKEFYVDLESKMCFDKIPEIVKIGFVKFQKDGDMYYPFNCCLDARRPLRRGEIIGDDNVCFVGKDIVLLKNIPSVFYIHRRYSDGKRFIIGKKRQESNADALFDLYYDRKNPVEICQRK